MKLAIIGSRDYPNLEAVRAYVASLPPSTVVVTGGWPSRAGGYNVVEPTRGVDREAYIAAEARGLVTIVIAGSHSKHEHMAGVQRNPVIADVGECVAAFWDTRSRGTGGTLKLFAQLNKGVIVFGEDGMQVPHWRQFLPR